jgi:hypothetical protein
LARPLGVVLQRMVSGPAGTIGAVETARRMRPTETVVQIYRQTDKFAELIFKHLKM